MFLLNLSCADKRCTESQEKLTVRVCHSFEYLKQCVGIDLSLHIVGLMKKVACTKIDLYNKTKT